VKSVPSAGPYTRMAPLLLRLLLTVLVQAGPQAAASSPRQTATPQEPPAVAAFREGAAAQQRGDMERAAEAYRRAIAIDPRFAEAHANLGAVLARLGRYDEAVASANRALGIKPGLTAARLNLGLAHYRAGALAAALEAFSAVHAAEPSLLQARQLLGLVLVELGRDSDAIAHLEASAVAEPDEPAVLFALGRAYSRLGDPRADSIADRLARTPAGQPLWHQLRGLVLQRDDRHQQALEAFAAAAALNAGLPQLSVNVGVSRLALGDRDGARQAFADAIERSDRDAAPHIYLAWMDEQDDRLADALRHAERAVALENNLADSRGLLGRVLLKQRSPGEAVPHLEAAVAAEPRSAAWRFLLAQAYQRAGQPAAAAREFEQARRLKEQEVAQERK
jgi:tetratricopeptide (TPR) repeat protein